MPSFALTLPGIAASQLRSLPVAPVGLHQLTRTSKGWAFMVSGPTGATCAVETSTNLTDWTTVAYVVNQSGAVEFVHKDTSASKRFFRVRLVNP